MDSQKSLVFFFRGAVNFRRKKLQIMYKIMDAQCILYIYGVVPYKDEIGTRTLHNALAICFPEGRPPGHPGGDGTVLVLFSRDGGELFSFGNDFAGPRGHTHGICSRQCDWQGEKCFTW